MLFGELVLLSNVKDNWDNFLFGKWSMYFKWMGCTKERTFLRKGATGTFHSTAVFFERSAALSFKDMVLPSNIDKSWALKGGVTFFSRHIPYSATIYTSYSATILFLLFEQMAAALSEVFFFQGKCICLRKYIHQEKGRQEECT